ncbi:type I-E CRISPR-associated protein Cas7/Cse4/CasC [Methylocaldum sp.]|uniref:type I-E CRISPR-associated protein Cas7/Cse4/CasC n=1 Tax=Methylocaldum sp. TaxID=1969727 RepID=UPI002D27C1D7|nr:type I-E CRISPR-associated protein Cas7/Cse4/CasC [Methylocaldum sp.]HYE36208.1 type I-E CRISPR-associated protein Cas7/Cse4/CasC [Methylocaldum sp.]
MTCFIQLHLLTSFPPSNLNRDDLGRPKTAVMGGETRLRISSQSLKRAWRTSEVMEAALKDHKGTRTKLMGVEIYKALKQKGVKEKQAQEWAQKIASVFGKLEASDKKAGEEEQEEVVLADGSSVPKALAKTLAIRQLAHISPEERNAIDALTATLAERGTEPTADELQLLREKHTAADIALFGRMLADAPRYNMEAAAQVAHAISVHKVAIEDDFFTAVDDLNKGIEDVGAGHMGETEFAAGLFYLYLCIDKDLLVENLNGGRELANRALSALVEAAATVAPTGKQNSFGSRARASFILAERGSQQPRSLSVAFLKPVDGYKDGMLANAIKALTSTRENMDKVYGPCADACSVMDATKPEGGLQAILNFVKDDCHA